MDRPQVMTHMRYCLRAATQASELLGADEELRAQWRDRLEHSPGAPALSGLEKACYEANSPEFDFGRPYRPQPTWAGEAKPVQPGWYFGQTPWGLMSSLRNGSFVAERDLPIYRKQIEAWRRPNGFRVSDAAGKEIPTTLDAFGRVEFPTSPGTEYRLSPLY